MCPFYCAWVGEPEGCRYAPRADVCQRIRVEGLRKTDFICKLFRCYRFSKSSNFSSIVLGLRGLMSCSLQALGLRFQIRVAMLCLREPASLISNMMPPFTALSTAAVIVGESRAATACAILLFCSSQGVGGSGYWLR